MGYANEVKNYRALHYWVEARLGTPQSCDECLKCRKARRKLQYARSRV